MSLSEDILIILAKHDCIFSSVAHLRIANDIQKLGWETVKNLSNRMSPSQLGKMRYLGVRWLAVLKRDNPDKYV